MRRSVGTQRLRALEIVTMWAATAGLALCSLPVAADESPDLLNEPFYVALGSFILSSDTVVRLDGEAQRGDQVDFENTFGGGDLTRFRVDGYWRFADKHKIRALWFNSSRTKSRVLDEDITWGDEVFPVHAETKSKVAFDIYELAYEYAFLRRDNYEVSGTAGLHYTQFETTLSAKASSSGGTLDHDISQKGSVGAPLPVFGLRGMWRLPHDFWFDASAQIFALSIDEYSGNIQDYRAAVFWQPKTWLGLGLGYNRFAVNVDVDKDRFKGSLDWTYRGPMLFYSGAF